VSDKFYHIVAHKKTGQFDKKALDAILKHADDWMTYAPGVWIVKTKEDGEVWRDRFSQIATTVMVTPFSHLDTSWLFASDAYTWFEKHGMNFTIEDT
jgi:hypothetical protein